MFCFKSQVPSDGGRSKGASLSLLSLIFILVIGSRAAASHPLCADLFSRQGSQEKGTDVLSALDSDDLNQPTQTYLRHLVYLISDRHLLGPDVLQAIAKSDQPINPFGERPVPLNQYPHQEAFRQLLKEDLQWPRIRQSVQLISRAAQNEKQRQESATEETKTILMPTVRRVFDFVVEETVRTTDGKTLGVKFHQDNLGKNFEIKAVDLTSGQELASLSHPSSAEPKAMSVSASGETALLAIPQAGSPQLMVFDLLANKMIANVKVGSATIRRSFLVEDKGHTKVLTIDEKTNARLVDPYSLAVGPEIPIDGSPELSNEKMGAVGNSIYLAEYWGPSYLLSPLGQKPLIKNDKFRAIDAFTYQGRTYGLGMRLAGFNSRSEEMELAVFDFETGQAWPSIKVPTSQSVPRSFETFEQDGKLYGLIAADYDLMVVDLAAGQVVERLSSTPQGQNLADTFRALIPKQVTFQFKGRTYLPAVFEPEDSNGQVQLVILDALTLRPVTNGMPLGNFVENVRIVSQDPEGILALVNLNSGGSRLVSLTLQQ